MGLMLLTGGARSGKSAFAIRAATATGRTVTLIATAEPRDEEMAAKIAQHRASRPGDWRVLEEPLEIVAAFRSIPPEHVVILDCLTLWVSNLLERDVRADEIEARANDAADEAAGRLLPAFVVTNEVGDGIVPADPETRRYRDLMGMVNAIFANVATRVFLVVAGRIVPLERTEDVIADG